MGDTHTIRRGEMRRSHKSSFLVVDGRSPSRIRCSHLAWAFKPVLTITILGLIVSGPCISAQSEGIRISAFVMGHSQWIWANPFRILFMRDPLFRYTIYPLPPFISEAGKAKLDRVYYPRTRDLLIDNYDLMVFHDLRTPFTVRQVHDLDYAFREAGMTAMCGLCLGWDYAWEPTILADVLPISEHNSVSPHFRGYWVVFRRERDPVFLPFIELGIQKVVGDQYTEMKVKQGATIWGDIKPFNLPWMVSWRPGGKKAGMQWVVSHTFEGWWAEENNPYGLDVATNMVLYSLDRLLISDIHARREARRLFTNLQTQKSLILSMMEWADNFGANVVPLSERLIDLEGEMEGATTHYFEQDYPATISFLESVSRVVMEITADAVYLKDEALFWVYVSEWLVVTATGIAAAAMVWSLMVRRRMYRIAGATRLR